MNTQFKKSAGILFLAVSMLLASCAGDEKEKSTETVIAVPVQIGFPATSSDEIMTVSGQIESQETAIISTRAMGFISSIRVKPGDHVQQGQLLVTINNDDILARRAQAQAMIQEAEAAWLDAQKDYERFRELYQQQSATAKEFENATLRYHSFQAKAEAARQLKTEAEAMLTYTNLVAPFAGVITQKYNDTGSMANPGMPILVLEQTAYQVTASVSENEIGQLKKGTPVEVIVKSSGKKIAGEISEISPSSQFSGGQFPIKIRITKAASSGVFSGMHVTVRIPTKKTSEAQGLFVPAKAIIHQDQLTGIYTVSEDQTAQLRWLKTGNTVGDQIEVLSGLKPDEKLIIQSDGRLYTGVLVSIQ